MQPDQSDYLRDRMLAEEVMAARAATPAASAIHRELAARYRQQLGAQRRAERRTRLHLSLGES